MDLSPRTDAAIQQDVQRELLWDTSLQEGEVRVVVAAGIVTLGGTVDRWATRVAAQEAAYRVHGVLDVVNDLDVRTPSTSCESERPRDRGPCAVAN